MTAEESLETIVAQNNQSFSLLESMEGKLDWLVGNYQAPQAYDDSGVLDAIAALDVSPVVQTSDYNQLIFDIAKLIGYLDVLLLVACVLLALIFGLMLGRAVTSFLRART